MLTLDECGYFSYAHEVTTNTISTSLQGILIII